TRSKRDWSSDVCSSDLHGGAVPSGHWAPTDLTTSVASNAPTTAPWRMGDIQLDEHRAAARIRQGGTGLPFHGRQRSIRRVCPIERTAAGAAAALQVTVEILRSATSRARLGTLAEAQFGDMVKASPAAHSSDRHRPRDGMT